MKIGIIVAMDKEFAQLKTLLTDCKEEQHGNKTFVLGQLGQHQLILQQCGIGKVNSAIGTVEMIHAYNPELIISTGVAGGADVNLNVTEVVVSTACCYHDVYCGSECAPGQVLGQPQRFDTPSSLHQKATRMQSETPVHSGLIVTGDWFVDSKEKIQSILNQFPEAKAVDMESASIAHTCHAYNIPFVSFRIISDIPLKDTDASQYFDFWERLANGSFEVTKQFLLSL